MPVQRLSERVGPWFQDELEKISNGEDFYWEFIATPTQTTPAMPSILLQTPSPIVGDAIGAHLAMPNALFISEEEVRTLARDAVEFCRQQRSQVLSQQNGHNGNGTGPGGLHLP